MDKCDLCIFISLFSEKEGSEALEQHQSEKIIRLLNFPFGVDHPETAMLSVLFSCTPRVSVPQRSSCETLVVNLQQVTHTRVTAIAWNSVAIMKRKTENMKLGNTLNC